MSWSGVGAQFAAHIQILVVQLIDHFVDVFGRKTVHDDAPDDDRQAGENVDYRPGVGIIPAGGGLISKGLSRDGHGRSKERGRNTERFYLS